MNIVAPLDGACTATVDTPDAGGTASVSRRSPAKPGTSRAPAPAAQLSSVEGADLTGTIADLQLHEVAYQAALGATSRVLQPSLLEFLR